MEDSMKSNDPDKKIDESSPFDISDDDVLKAMKDIDGYLDITPRDFRTLYRFAYLHAFERLTQRQKAQDVMTVNVISVKKETPSEEVANIMATEGISGLPVVDDNTKVIGVVSEKDFLFNMGTRDTRSFMEIIAHCLKNKGCLAISMRNQKAVDIMTSPAVTVNNETSIFEIANIFTKDRINRVPVTDHKNRLIGIVARADIVQASCMSPDNI
jgi:CBS domain-containing membrane protein